MVRQAQTDRWIPFPSLRSAGNDKTGKLSFPASIAKRCEGRESMVKQAQTDRWIPFPSLRSAGNDTRRE